MRLAHDVIAKDIVAASIRRLSAKPQILDRAFQQRTGLVAATAGVREWENARVHEAVRPHMEEWWADRVEYHYQYARAHFARAELQIGYVVEGELVIGDAPVITRREGHGGHGVHQGVALEEASTVVMPIAPNVLIGLGPTSEYVRLERSMVDKFNVPQLRAFHRWLGCRPGGVGERWLLANVSARTVLPQL